MKALALLLLFYGCGSVAPASPGTPGTPMLNGQVEINGLMSCRYTVGVLSDCALNAGSTLDSFANSVLAGVSVTTGVPLASSDGAHALEELRALRWKRYVKALRRNMP